LIDELEGIYRRAFDAIGSEDMGEGAVARLTQLLLRSREGAISPLQEEIEAPLITRAPDNPAE
jgi:hercynine metabolism small protein